MKQLNKAMAGTVEITSITGGQNAELRLAEMGFLPGERVQVLGNPGWGPVTVMVKGSKMALGQGLAAKIMVRENV
jgi:ferrous iron transport protein A